MSNQKDRKKRGKGRPKLDEDSETFRLLFRLTEADMKVLKTQAERFKMPLAKYLRTMIRMAVSPEELKTLRGNMEG